MSITRINQYYKDLERIKSRATTQNELAIKSAFKNLLNDYCRTKDLEVIEEQTIVGSNKRPDGVVVDAFKFRYGYWEAKDANDDIEKEIVEKQRSNYPMFNFLIENSIHAVLIQGDSKQKIEIEDKQALHQLISQFIAYERTEIKEFKQAITQFQTDLPQIIEVLREMIAKQNESSSSEFAKSRADFFAICQEAINPNIKLSDIDEMLIQHILTEDIFKAVFDDEVFHEENNIAKALKKIEQTFFSGDVKRKTLAASRPYYAQIKARATEMQDYSQKQEFLKGIYENFYKAYNPKAADTLGIVYTPKEIVNFMLESTDYLLEKHFGKTLSDKNVHILDPATGTGTFVTDLLNYLPKQDLEYKYKNEIHANEVAILPYYIANLNIEYTYKNRMKDYVEFKNLCWVDTLDSTGGLQYAGKKGDLFGVTAENTLRIKNQNEQKISVIIGNPPYNANQQNENDNNKNRTYSEIDKRIKDTYIKESTAQKTKVYDMYARFYRWAMDRVAEKGIIAFVTNRSFIDSKTFDGFRKIIERDFDECIIVDTKSDVRANPKISGTKNNVFGIQTGVAIMFLVKTGKK
jgi:predicted helicase